MKNEDIKSKLSVINSLLAKKNVHLETILK